LTPEKKNTKQEIEELEKKLESLKQSAKKEEKKESFLEEAFRILGTNHNWKFVAGAIFAWLILWIFNH